MLLPGAPLWTWGIFCQSTSFKGTKAPFGVKVRVPIWPSFFSHACPHGIRKQVIVGCIPGCLFEKEWRLELAGGEFHWQFCKSWGSVCKCYMRTPAKRDPRVKDLRRIGELVLLPAPVSSPTKKADICLSASAICRWNQP